MKRSMVVTGLAGLAVCGLVTAGLTGQASAAEDPYPESEGWIEVEDQRTIPAGYACKAEVVQRYGGHLKPFQVNEREFFEYWSEDSYVTFDNPANGRRVALAGYGGVHIRVSENGNTVRVTSYGGTAYFGKGIKGIVYGDGVQKLTVTQADTADATAHLRIINGTKRQVCHELGTQAVKGRNLPQPASVSASGSGSGSAAKDWRAHR